MSLTLIQYPPALGMHNASPFCLKAEMLLRLADLPYEVREQSVPSAVPKGRFPVLDDGGTLVPDSGFVRLHLEKTHGADFDAHLSRGERAIALAFEKLCEDHLYWALVSSRWVEEKNWIQLKAAFFGPVPWPIRGFIASRARANIVKRLQGQGFGAHSLSEVYTLGSRALEALETQLEGGPWLMGEHASAADATVYGTLYSILGCPLDSPLRRDAAARPALVAYTDRVDAWYQAAAPVRVSPGS